MSKPIPTSTEHTFETDRYFLVLEDKHDGRRSVYVTSKKEDGASLLIDGSRVEDDLDDLLRILSFAQSYMKERSVL